MTKEKRQTEPFVHVTRRADMNKWVKLAIRLGAVLLSFLIILIVASAITGDGLGLTVKYIFDGNFATGFNTEEMFKNVMFLLGIAVALAPAFKLRFWNVGAQGQVLFGALCASILAFYIGDKIPNALLLIMMLIVAVVGGALWALIPAVFKVKTGANETLFTLMMNYIAIQLVACFIDLWKGKNSALPNFNIHGIDSIFGLKYGITYLIVPLIAVIVFVYLAKTKQGYEIAVVGESMNTAKYAGINTSKVILRTIAISGAVCGLIGFLYVGNLCRLSNTADGGYGFTAIIVTWASQFNPIAMAAIAFGIVFFEGGAGGIVDKHSNILNAYFSYIIVAIFLFLLIGCEFFINYRINFSEKVKEFFKKIFAKKKKTQAETEEETARPAEDITDDKLVEELPDDSPDEGVPPADPPQNGEANKEVE